MGEKVTVEDIINLPTGTAYIKTLVQGIPQDAMSIRMERVVHESGTQDIEASYIQDSMERYGTPAKKIVEKRSRVNHLYYAATDKAKFTEKMQRYTTEITTH